MRIIPIFLGFPGLMLACCMIALIVYSLGPNTAARAEQLRRLARFTAAFGAMVLFSALVWLLFWS